MNALILLFYRIVTFFTRVPKKSRLEHIDIFQKLLLENDIIKGSYINNQYSFSEFPYGKGNVGLNGCGPIAVFNALIALKEINTNCDDSSHLNDVFINILTFFEKHGTVLQGKFGTSPLVIKRYFINHGYITKTTIKKSAVDLNNFSNNFQTFISIVFNDKNGIYKGLHFICSKKNDDGTFTTYNPEHTGNTLFETLKKCSNNEIRHIYTIGIRKGDIQ